MSDLGLYAFAGCGKLVDSNGFFIRGGVLYGYFGDDGEIAIPDGVTRIAPAVFYGRRDLTEVAFPAGLTSIGTQSFCCCHGLKQVVIPESVACIECGAFWSCSGLEKADVPSQATIGEAAFDGTVIITRYG